MSEWQSMDGAPKGSVQTMQRKIGKNMVEITEHVAPTIIAASATCDTVCLSRWLENEGRWNMFKKDSPPMSWQPWPGHPLAARGDAP